MAPEIIIAVITAASVLGAAVVAAIPTLMTSMRRTRGAVAAEGEETRAATVDAMSVVSEQITAIGSRLDSRIDDVRDDIDDVREDIARVREWQAAHDAEHMLIGRPRPGATDT